MLITWVPGLIPIIVYIEHYCCEKASLSITKKSMGGQPPGLYKTKFGLFWLHCDGDGLKTRENHQRNYEMPLGPSLETFDWIVSKFPLDSFVFYWYVFIADGSFYRHLTGSFRLEICFDFGNMVEVIVVAMLVAGWGVMLDSGPWFNIKMLSYQYMKSHCEDKMVVRFLILVRWHLYIDSVPSSPSAHLCPLASEFTWKSNIYCNDCFGSQWRCPQKFTYWPSDIVPISFDKILSLIRIWWNNWQQPLWS